MAAVFTFENGKQICFDRTIYANGKYVFLKDYQLLDEERRAVRDQLTRANNQIDNLKEQIAKLEKTRSSWADNAVEWREKCEKDEKKIKELEHELRKKDNSETYGLDFTEHDKVFKDEIASLKRQIEKLESIRTRCHESARDSFDLGNYGCLHIVTVDELKKSNEKVAKIESELFDAQKSADEYYNKCIDLTNKIAELKSELKAKNDFETGRIVKLPFDPLETANMLINATYKRKVKGMDRLHCCEGYKLETDMYSINDLEQIAEHLLVYCKHNKDSEE